MSQPSTLAEVIRAAVSAGAAGLRVCMPAIVQSYDAAHQTVVVQPQLKFNRMRDDDTVVAETPPPIYRCPVQFPGGGGYAITFPVQQGDPCLLVFADRSLDVWMDNGGTGRVVDPIDPRIHDLSDAIALLGVRSAQGALTPTPPTDRVALGQPGGLRVEIGPVPGVDGASGGPFIDLGGASGDFVALASLVLQQLTAIANAFSGHTHSATGIIDSTLHPCTGATAPGPTYSAASVASGKVKAQ